MTRPFAEAFFAAVPRIAIICSCSSPKCTQNLDSSAIVRVFAGRRYDSVTDLSSFLRVNWADDRRIQDWHGIRITCYVFKPRVDKRTVKETRETIQRKFFKNNMSVLFSVNGQVHGHYTSEFITRSLKFPLLKDYLLIHVDCTEVRHRISQRVVHGIGFRRMAAASASGPKVELNAIHFLLTRRCHMREGKRTQHMMPALLDFWFDNRRRCGSRRTKVRKLGYGVPSDFELNFGRYPLRPGGRTALTRMRSPSPQLGRDGNEASREKRP